MKPSHQVMVSVRIITYNQEQYIEQCIRSVLEQKTNFFFEIVIGDDGSSDQTSIICDQLKKEYPQIIRHNIRDRNLLEREKYSPPWRYNWLKTLEECNGKYIALLDGDDYWTDPYKLQKQVDFLRNNPNYSMCFHDVQKIQGNNEKEVMKPQKLKKFFDTKDILINNGKEMATCSLLLNADLLKKIPQLFLEAPVFDFPLKLFYSEFGYIGYLPESMAVYRYQTQNSWSAKKQTAIEEHYVKMKSFLNEYLKWTKMKNKKYIKKNCSIRKAEYIRIKIENSDNMNEKLNLLVRNIFSYNIFYTLINIKKIL